MSLWTDTKYDPLQIGEIKLIPLKVRGKEGVMNIKTTMTKTFTCAIITPVGPGHESLYEAALESVHKSFQGDRGIFSEIVPLKIDDPEGQLGRSKARNIGIRKADELGVEWIFFLDADDLMAPMHLEV